MPVKVDIVLPCYNPGDKWPDELRLFWLEASKQYDIRFILVNDGTQGTKINAQLNLPALQNIPIHYLNYSENKGKGFALRHGVKQTTAGYVVYTDIDFPFTNESVLNLIHQLVRQPNDVVAGFRSRKYYQKSMSGFRVFLSKAFRFFIQRILKIEITDTQCGLKGFNGAGRQKFLNTTINRYLFDFEFIYHVCRDKNLKVSPVEVQLKENVQFSKMKLKIVLQELFNLARVLIKIR